MIRIDSRDWQDMLDRLERIAKALERLATVSEARASDDATAEKVAGDLNASADKLKAALPPT